MDGASQETQKAVKWYPPAYDVRVERVPVPVIEHPDDVIVKIQLSGLCGSDLHVYRGHEGVEKEHIGGHEFVGTVVSMGSSFRPDAVGRPELYSTLKVGDKVVSPFTVSCGECHYCRVGFTCRCIRSILFGTPTLPGGQAQFIRVPWAGGTLFKVDSIAVPSADGSIPHLTNSSLLLMADILPTGAFAALQALQHVKNAPMLTGVAYPFNGYMPNILSAGKPLPLPLEDRILTFAVIGLGPVGVCAAVSLVDMLEDIVQSTRIPYRVVTVDPNESRRDKMQKIATNLSLSQLGTIRVADIPEATQIVGEWTAGIGCNAVLEIVGNNSALSLSYDLVQPFGLISSVGVLQEPPLPFNGRQMFDKNVSFDFGRCPVRSMLPIAAKILLNRQNVFGDVGGECSLIDRVVSLDEAVKSYELFDKGMCGKILFDPWI